MIPEFNTKKLIGSVYKTAFTRESTKQRGGIYVFGEGKKILASATYEFAWGKHVEIELLSKPEIMVSLNSARKVTLYTYFAPCPNCYKFLVNYPLTFSKVKFYLAYSDPLPVSAKYTIKTVKDNLSNLHQMGWKVRQWSSARYHEPKKLVKLCSDITRTFTYPVGDGVKMLNDY